MLDYMVRFGIPVDMPLPRGAESMSIKVEGHELSYLLFKAGKEYVAASRMLVQFKAGEALEDHTVYVRSDSDDSEKIRLGLAKEAQKSLKKHVAKAADEKVLKSLIKKKPIPTETAA